MNFMLKPPKMNARTQQRQHEIEQIFINRKEEIAADIADLENNMTDLARKYNVGERSFRRWAERLGWCVRERHKQRNALRKGTKLGPITAKKSTYDDKPEAEKVWALWK